MITAESATLLREGIHDLRQVSGLTHDFYRYPARFSPAFVNAAIGAFSDAGDLVFDPFMGGGTVIVEATSLGRQGIGTDINSLAVFITQAKTTLLVKQQLFRLESWAERSVSSMNIHSPTPAGGKWASIGYHRNIGSRQTWRIRKLLELGLNTINELGSADEKRVARCILLKTGQWALDCRRAIPSVSEFRQQVLENSREMVESAKSYADAVRLSSASIVAPVCLNRSVIGIEDDPAFKRHKPIRLVITSPPYPGVHVLYHRWQVQGRRETPAPYWIANSLDGSGASYYTFGDRKERALETYYTQTLKAFTSIARVCTKQTIVVQMIAFPDPKVQLTRYLEVMRGAGFSEVKFTELANRDDGRVWRTVPNRKWYASQRGDLGSSKEVVLFHSPAPSNSDGNGGAVY